MDWLIKSLTISIVAGLFTLALLRKRKNSDEISSENNPKRNDESNEKKKKNEITNFEQRAQQIIKQHLSIIASPYEKVKNELGYTGFMHYYLQHSQNDQTMSTTADYNVMLELASIDKFRDHKTFLIVSKNSRK